MNSGSATHGFDDDYLGIVILGLIVGMGIRTTFNLMQNAFKTVQSFCFETIN